MKHKVLISSLACLLLCAAARAQSPQFNSDFISGTQCVSVTSSGLAMGSYGVTGTWTGTLTAYGVVGQGAPVSLQSQTANGSYTVSSAGYTLFKVCGNSVASGAAFVQVSASVSSITGGGGLPAGLTYVAPTFTVSTAGSGNGALALSGTTSGTATCTAPAVAGTITNGVVCTNEFWGVGYRNASGAGGFGFSGASLLVKSAGTAATVFIQDNAGNNYFNCTSLLCSTAAALNFGFSGGKGQHFNTQAANNDFGGVCTGAATTCAVAFTTAYTSTPACVITPTTAGVTSAIITTQATTGFTVTYAPSAATTFNYICAGNPN